MEKLISVVIPIYNVSQYLKQCVDSVLNQSYKNLEIILVDDGSTDDSGIISDRYALLDSRVVVIHKENGGLSDARNAGIAKAQGEYIGFVDSDDFIHPDMYRELALALEENNADIAMANWQNFFDGSEDEIKDCRTGNVLVLEGAGTLEFLMYGKDGYRISFSVWDRLYRREIIDGMLFPKGKCYEDIVWSSKVFHKSKKSVYIDKNLYYYRRRADSIVGLDVSHGISERIMTDEIPQIEGQIQFLRDIGQDKMADEATYSLYEKLLKYYALCQRGKSGHQNELLRLIRKYKVWARGYFGNCGNAWRKLVLLVSLYVFKALIFLLYVKNRLLKI